MRLRTVLTMKIPLPRLPYAWPLIFLAVPAFVGLFLVVGRMIEGLTPGEYPSDGVIWRFDTNWRLHWACRFLSQRPTTLVVAAIWLAVDVFLIGWAGRAHRKGGEPARPARLFFAWQGAKFALFLLYFAIMFAYRPFEPYFHVCPHG